jgi:hypothetical protein
MSEEWKVYNLFVRSPDINQEVTENIKSFAKTLVTNGDLNSFYYNLYNVPPKVPAHIRFGFYKLEDAKILEKKFDELKEQGKIAKAERVQPDLTDVNGVAMDKIKLTARKITDIIQEDFGGITEHQASYLIHYTHTPHQASG